MQAVNNEPDYLVLYGQCRRKIAHLETQINKMVAKHNKEVETLKKELNYPKLVVNTGNISQPHKVLLTVCQVTNTTAGELMGETRNRTTVIARQLFFYVGRYEYNFNWATMSDLLGRHHSTAIHGSKRYSEFLELGYKQETKMYNAVIQHLKQ